MACSKRKSAARGLIGMVLFWAAVQEASAAVIEEVVVTAQKRSESTQDVPIAIAAYGERRLEDAYTDEIYYTAFNRNAGFAQAGGSDLADDYSNLNLRMFWYSADTRKRFLSHQTVSTATQLKRQVPPWSALPFCHAFLRTDKANAVQPAASIESSSW